MMLKSSQRLSIVTVLIILGIKCRGGNMIDQKESNEIDNSNIVQSCGDRKSEMSRVNVLSFHHNSRRSLVKNRAAAHDKPITSNVNRMPAHVITQKSAGKLHRQLIMHQRIIKKLKDIRHSAKNNDETLKKNIRPNSIIQYIQTHVKLHQMHGMKSKNWQKKQIPNRLAYNRNKSRHSRQHSAKRRGRKQSLMKLDGGGARIGQKNSHGKRSVVRKAENFNWSRRSHSFDKRLKYLRRQRKNDWNCIMDRSRILSSIHNSPSLLDAIFS